MAVSRAVVVVERAVVVVVVVVMITRNGPWQLDVATLPSKPPSTRRYVTGKTDQDGNAAARRSRGHAAQLYS